MRSQYFMLQQAFWLRMQNAFMQWQRGTLIDEDWTPWNGRISAITTPCSGPTPMQHSGYNSILIVRIGVFMFILRNIRVGLSFIAGIVSMFAFVPAGLCQTTAAQESEPTSSETIEEIIVYGDKSLTRLRHEQYRAQEDFFDLFNTLNSNDAFDIKCDFVTFLGERRRHHICQPNFGKKFEAEMTQRMIQEGTWGVAPHHLNLLEKKREQLWIEMAELVDEHPELNKSFQNLDKVKRVYESERQRRCEGSKRFCKN